MDDQHVLWHLGNTTVRSAMRLAEGLRVLSTSHLIGNLIGRQSETDFALLLNRQGIVDLSDTTEDVSSLGRKWRSALGKLGFIVPLLKRDAKHLHAIVGDAFTITENGRRLLQAQTVPAMQEVFLRSLAAYRIPSVIEDRYHCLQFSPLRHTIATLFELENRTGSSRLNFIEFALHVQTTSGGDDPAQIADAILATRSRREAFPNKKAFDRDALQKARDQLGRGPAPSTYRDYADASLRYLKATGLVGSAGRGIALVYEQRIQARMLCDEELPTLPPEEYLKQLFAGAALPTDNASTGAEVLSHLLELAQDYGVAPDLTRYDLSSAGGINVARLDVEELIFHKREEEFAAKQVDEYEEISTFMRMLMDRRETATLKDGVTELRLPRAEMPAYFEWTLWRAFLAMNHLVNPPHEARRFKIDQDFLPVGTAPGGGPDLVIEFDDFVVVVEVTLTEGSRQEAAEGEPVRRHVAEKADQFAGQNKPVYGLFVARQVDSNAAETFRIGVWYRGDDSRMALNIVPLTLRQFYHLFQQIYVGYVSPPVRIRELLDDCLRLRDSADEAPQWKSMISERLETLRTSS